MSNTPVFLRDNLYINFSLFFYQTPLILKRSYLWGVNHSYCFLFLFFFLCLFLNMNYGTWMRTALHSKTKYISTASLNCWNLRGFHLPNSVCTPSLTWLFIDARSRYEIVRIKCYQSIFLCFLFLINPHFLSFTYQLRGYPKLKNTKGAT